jgi:hypothetical protein
MGAINSNMNRLNGALKEKRMATHEKSTITADAIDIEWREKYWFEFVKSHHTQVDWKEICKNPNLTMNMIDNNIDFLWDWTLISSHKNLTLEMINKHPDKSWDWKSISDNKSITIEMMLQYPNMSWHWNLISKNPNLTIEMIRNLPENKRDWKEISKNPAITFDMIIANPDLPWNWNEVSANPNINMEIINANLDKPWAWGKISCNKNIIPNTKARVDEDFIHGFRGSAQNYGLDMLLKKALDTDDDWFMFKFCINPHLTFDYIDTHPEIFQNGDALHLWGCNLSFSSKWEVISNNTFPIEKQKYIDSQTVKCILISLHDFYNENPRQVITTTEYTFFDCYITKHIVEFL